MSSHVAVLSLEPWDEVWRRNQHLATRLVSSGAADRLTFVTPVRGAFAARAVHDHPLAGIEVVTPPLLVPRRYGGHTLLRPWLRRAVRDADVVWINDPVAGAALIGAGKPLVYDVTDDWRSMPQREDERRRTVAAEDALAGVAETVVCSEVLRGRWQQRYGVEATVIPNGVDVTALRTAPPIRLEGPGPHAVYVGTLHENRVDLDLVTKLIARWPGTLHLVGPTHLPAAVVTAWVQAGADVCGPVAANEVPGWLNAADLLVCPHVVDAFTLSLDAIKSHEYLATDRPVVATASCGFQELDVPGLTVASRDGFVEAAIASVGSAPTPRTVAVHWDERARVFAGVLGLSARTSSA